MTADIRALIPSPRTTVARTVALGVDLVQVHTNVENGRRIIEQEQRGKNRAANGKEELRRKFLEWTTALERVCK